MLITAWCEVIMLKLEVLVDDEMMASWLGLIW